ncbi:MAG: hypothetical protein QNJ55_23005 [Xenococcus sp. MO_188.B8]|nr:hypothetical protein [Xenococcus sp. MO_188.B8]
MSNTIICLNLDAFSDKEQILFTVETPINFRVQTTVSYWDLITKVKHPIMQGRLEDVKQTLTNPDLIHLSKTDSQVYLFYRADGNRRWVCAVTKKLNAHGFLITAYRTSAIKEGEKIWQK